MATYELYVNKQPIRPFTAGSKAQATEKAEVWCKRIMGLVPQGIEVRPFKLTGLTREQVAAAMRGARY